MSLYLTAQLLREPLARVPASEPRRLGNRQHSLDPHTDVLAAVVALDVVEGLVDLVAGVEHLGLVQHDRELLEIAHSGHRDLAVERAGDIQLV